MSEVAQALRLHHLIALAIDGQRLTGAGQADAGSVTLARGAWLDNYRAHPLLWLVPLGFFILDHHAHWLVAGVGIALAVAAAVCGPSLDRHVPLSGALFSYGLLVAFAGLFILQFLDDGRWFSGDAELTILEWWNDPPTEPLREPGQLQEVVTLSANGGWGFASAGQTRSEFVSNNFHLYYDTFAIPRDSVALFEVSLVANYVGYKGMVSVDFASYDGAMILCPSVELAVVNPLPGGLTVVDGGMT